ncbi:MAG: hypothetical protein PUD65_04500 [Spirochaetales bacterium]|nr:hypothetical protein [Spirochaetales bacterium]
MRIYSQRKGSFARSMARAIVKSMPKNELDDETVNYLLKGLGIIALILFFIMIVVTI